MSNWLPDLSVHAGPKYRAIVDAIAADVDARRLLPGTRMPTHRDLAWRLKVTVGTVARAYTEAERLGLLSGEVGRGTFVTDPERQDSGLGQYLAVAWAPHPGIINMAVNRPSGDQGAWAVGPVLAQLARRPDLPQLLSYNLEVVAQRHRTAGQKWLKLEGAEVPVEQVSVTAGSQQALVAAIATLTRPGDTILAEEYTYPGFKSAVSMLGRSLAGVMMDDGGLIPDEVERGFARGARLLYTTATVQNPTTATLSEDRRRAIAEAARRHDAFILEDGVHRFLDPLAPAHSGPCAGTHPLSDHLVEKRDAGLALFVLGLAAGGQAALRRRHRRLVPGLAGAAVGSRLHADRRRHRPGGGGASAPRCPGPHRFGRPNPGDR